MKFLHANRPQHFRFDGLGKSDDCVQWRSQLVTYVGMKVTLRSVRRFRPRALRIANGLNVRPALPLH